MKKILSLLSLLLFNANLFSQVSINNFDFLQEKLEKDTWVVSCFADILKSKNRDTIKQFIFDIEEFTNWDYAFEEWIYWYEKDYFIIEKIVLNNNTMLDFGEFFSIIIKNINIVNNYIIVKGTENIENLDYDNLTYLDWSKLRTISKNGTFKMIFIFDGDYLDIFINEIKPENYFYSFCRFNDSTLYEFENLIYTNTCDLTNVTFPRRADKNHSVGTSCIVAENLRLRKEESTSSATLHTMKAGTKVTILQLGKQQTIDGITANWVQVQLADGQNTRGWCFGGYLLEH